MSKGQDELDPLPSEKLCNKFRPYNHTLKIPGDGPLGNEKKEKMHYKGNDKKEVVITLQKMLKTLGYDLGTSGPNNDGVDGKFWDSTEEAVIDFQGKNKDWDGEQLKEEGKVGPRSSDALNRAVVGKEYETMVGDQSEKQKWHDHYQTPVKLTSKYVLLTATAKALENPVTIEIDDEKKGKVVIVGQIPEIVREATLTIRLIDTYGKPAGNARYRLEVEDRQFEGHTTEADGILSHKISKNAKTGKLILDTIIYNLIISDDIPMASINRWIDSPDYPSPVQ
ncbi:MAG: peptidoglycan-binding protein [Candidatus Methanoperedens sp.]|nr:peptidoglycan-binding protein [Candidatus Methanoperedens sp.]MCE8429587.1 peptidoglycan-binding protein [Candidatus Methanoperedens sp.]